MKKEDQQRKKEREAVIKRLHTEGEEKHTKEIANRFGLLYDDYRTLFTQPSLLLLIPEDEAKTIGAAITEKTKRVLTLAILDPESAAIKALVEKLAKEHELSITLVVVSNASMEHLLQGYDKAPESSSNVGETRVRSEVVSSIHKKGVTFESIDELLHQTTGASTSQLLETILGGALFFRASDIHFESIKEKVRLRYRIDGVLRDISTIKSDLFQSMLSRLKILSKMKINIHNVPQSGRFTVTVEDREVEIRTATAPSEYGENVVLRILDPQTVQLDLQELGIRPDLLKKIEHAIEQPNGLILTTGPTGSGKTTSLYAFLLKRNNPEIKIITIEDPIEYHLEGIEQTEINPEAGVTFFTSLSSALRRDPDIILVGEIRDTDTASAAIQAALTGHIVFSTLHTNDAAGAIPRLIDLGIQAALIPSALRLIIAQRLMRRLCSECSESYKPKKSITAAITKELSTLPDDLQPDLSSLTLKKKSDKPCSACGGLGYSGRIGVFEALIVDETMEQLIAGGPSIANIHAAAKERGMITLKQDGFLKLVDGITSEEEIERVLGEITES